MDHQLKGGKKGQIFLILSVPNGLLFSLGVEPVDKDVIKQPPRNVKEPMITRAVIINILISASIIISGTIWVFYREVRRRVLVVFNNCVIVLEQSVKCVPNRKPSGRMI